jgi:hypothetical protein
MSTIADMKSGDELGPNSYKYTRNFTNLHLFDTALNKQSTRNEWWTKTENHLATTNVTDKK